MADNHKSQMIRPDGSPALPDDPWHYLDGGVGVLIASNVRVTDWDRARVMRWSEIVRDNREVASKTAAPLWTFGLVGDSMARCASSMTHASALVYDFDGKDAPVDPADVLDGMAGIAYWAHTTHSHTDDAPRFRVVLPLDVAIPADQFRDAWNAVAWILGIDAHVDQSAKDICRLSYLPTRAPGAPHWQEVNMGDGIPCIDWAAWSAVWAEKRATQAARVAPAPSAPLRVRDDSHEVRTIANQMLVARALEAVPPTCAYDQWMRIILACGKTLGAQGIDAAEEWSRRAPDKYSATDWKAFRRKYGGQV